MRAVIAAICIVLAPVLASAQDDGFYVDAEYLSTGGGTVGGTLNVSGDLNLALTKKVCFDTELNDCVRAAVDDRLDFQINGGDAGFLRLTSFETGSGKSALMNEVPSATNPTLVPNSNESSSGVGHQGTNAPNMIAGGVEVARFTLANSVALFQMLGRSKRARATIAADDVTPSVAAADIFLTSANGGATAITDLDDPVVDQVVTICGGSSTNASTIADSGNFNLTGAFTASLDDCIWLWVQADNDYVELGRVNN